MTRDLRGSLCIRFLAVAALGLAIAIVAGPVWIPAIGRALVLDDRRVEQCSIGAEVLAVPASPWLSDRPSFARLARAAGLIRDGRARSVVMTCPVLYGVSGCELAQGQLTARGYPRLPMREVPLPSSPAAVETGAILDEVSRAGAKSVTVLVAPFESRRSNRVYRYEAARRGINACVISVRDPGFDPGRWWSSRELRKSVAYEVLQWIGIP